MKMIPLLLCDFYKTVHSEQYPKGMTKLVSYFTPRMSRLQDENKLIMFGLQGFIKEYLIEYFNEWFFNRLEEEVVAEYNRILTATQGAGTYNDEKIRALHRLGYLPLQISAIAEGTQVPVRVPMIEITNSHKDFAWLVNTIETLMSCSLWHPMISANVGYRYRQIVNKWYDKTVDDDVPRARALGDFSMRGQESLESATRSSAAWLLSFLNTATIPAIPWLESYYNCDCTKESVGFGSLSTEHSVMNSNYAVDGDEITMLRRLLTEIYPNNNFSVVSDSYDYWNLVNNILPRLKKEILEHNGTMLIRGDSGDPVDIICGTIKKFVDDIEECEGYFHYSKDFDVYERNTGKYYHVFADSDFGSSVKEFEPTPEQYGTVNLLWKHLGGTINSKGYKVLNSKIKAIYGDSITPQREERIYCILEKLGFSAQNVVLGSGSFSMQCLEEVKPMTCECCGTIHDIKGLSPYTRDTFGIAVKSTYCEIDGEPIHIYKDPKTDTGNFKKSQRGCCCVFEEDGEIKYRDGYSWDEVNLLPETENNLLQLVFSNGEMIIEQSLSEIRSKLHGGKF